jgi:predicted metalloprotease with PDZ domain
MLVRAGLITENDYLKLVARHITQLMRTPARATQSISESSFDAWIKYYRQDENTPNAIVSYYLKGGLIALLLDLKLRAENKGSLDDVMRFLWREYGSKNIGVPEDAFGVFEQCSGASLREFEALYVNGVAEPDWKGAFASVGVHFEARASINALDRGGPASGAVETHLRQLGMVLIDTGDAKLRYVLSQSAAHAAGLCAGDTLVAIDGLRATRTTLQKHLARFTSGELLSIHYFRQDEIRQTELRVPTPDKDAVTLRLAEDVPQNVIQRRRNWLVVN